MGGLSRRFNFRLVWDTLKLRNQSIEDQQTQRGSIWYLFEEVELQVTSFGCKKYLMFLGYPMTSSYNNLKRNYSSIELQ